MLVVWKPELLEKDDLWLQVAQNVFQVELVPLHALTVERNH